MEEKVRHKTFGEGYVKNIKNGIIEISFGVGIKKFQFPKAFEMFLTTDNLELKAKIAEAKQKTIIQEKVQEQKKAEDQRSQNTVSREFHERRTSYDRSYSVSGPLIGDRAQTIDVRSREELFEIIGYMAAPGRVSSFEAEVPKDGRDKTFEMMFPGQTYRPIETGDTPSGLPNKLGPQFRINFATLRNCPELLKKNMGKGNGSCVGRINKSKFVIDMVQNYGFRFGDRQDCEAIRNIAASQGFIDAFERGYSR